MANTSEAATNAKQLPTFSNVKEFEQLAITLRAEGKSYAEVANMINAEYSLAYKEITLRGWFMAGGRLEQAYSEYLEWHADQSVMEAKLKIKKLSTAAAETLGELITDKFDGRVRQQAAKTILGKYVPDRQVVVDETGADEIPSAIGDAGDKVLTGDEPDGQNEVANPPEGAPADPDAGSGSN